MPSLPVALFWLAAQASQSSGTIRIEVIDGSTGHPLSDVTVVLSDADRPGRTGPDGSYVFTNVWPGPHHVAARRLGYAPRVLHAFVPGTGVLDLTLTLTPLPEVLTGVRVESRPTLPMRDVGAADSLHAGDRSLSLSAIRHHPLLAEPDAILAVAGGHVVAKPESPAGLNVIGGASDHVAYLLDGIPVLSPYHTGGTFGALNADALAGVELRVSPQSAALADALSGVVTASTRPVADDVQVAGGISATQARLTAEFPVGLAPRTGLLVSGRLLFPGLLGQEHEAAYIDGEGSDALVRLTASLGGGSLRVLAISSRSGLDVADRVADENTGAAPGRNDLRWGSHSEGARWERRAKASQVQFAVWRASSNADVVWMGDSAQIRLATRMRDAGVLALVRQTVARGEWTFGARTHSRSSRYESGDGSSPRLGLDLRGSAILATVHSTLAQRFSTRHELSGGVFASFYRGSVYPGPFLEWTWRPATVLTFAASVGRRTQYTQSLRNSESVVANIFPADLSVVAAGPVPVARSDQAMAVASWRPAMATVFTMRFWERHLAGLALSAIGNGEPFADTAIAIGRGRATGLSLDASLSRARWGVMANYAVQRVRMTARDTTWQPEHGVVNTLDAGLVFFPEPSASIRVGVSGATGRRVSGFGGAFEWEACNLLDRGCEFAGGPLRRDEPLGATPLPGYARVDVGARKHWHVTLGARNVQVAVYATWSNLFDRRNVLTYTRDTSMNQRRPVAMRPVSPLVIGFDWSF